MLPARVCVRRHWPQRDGPYEAWGRVWALGEGKIAGPSPVARRRSER
jgi:hypothetical protein